MSKLTLFMFFVTYLKKYWSDHFEIFWLFLKVYSTTFGKMPGFETDCLSFQAYCLNAAFWLAGQNILQIFLHIIIGNVKSFHKMYIKSYFDKNKFLHTFLPYKLATQKRQSFCKCANFLQILSVKPNSFPKMYNMLYLTFKLRK